MSFSRSARLAFVLSGLLAAAPTAARAQTDCLPPGSEENASAPVCNFEPEANVTPSAEVGQPAVPVTIHAADHWSDNAFGTFKILLDDTVVTSQWTVTQTESGSGTGVKKTFRSSGHVNLSTMRPVRSLAVELCDVQYCTRSTSTFTLRLPAVEVTPDAAFTEEVAGLSRSRTFTVINRGLQGASFALAATCQTGTTATACSLGTAGPLTLAAGTSGAVHVTFAAPTPGTTVRITLQATQTGTTGVTDAGWTEVSVRAPSAGSQQLAPGVALVPLNAGPATERSQCVTAAAGVGAAYECGDLRLAHALPANRTLGRTWSPVLLYNSRHAEGRGTVYADVTLPEGARVPLDFQVVVYLYHTGHMVSKSFPGSEWSPGTTRRVAVDVDGLATGLYFYYYQVMAREAGSQVSSPVFSGWLPVVNRSASPFGAG
ncbi:MAG TPA: hypothetical protein VK358_16755, partial [Longimicrobium sp.]|nr:hypothetical protein [Longimicrobium sp.]